MSTEKYHHPLDLLKQIEDERGSLLLEISKNRIELLKREFKFIDVLLSLRSFIHECYMPEVIEKVNVLRNHVYRLVHVGPDSDHILSEVENKIWTAKLEIRGECFVPRMSFHELSSKKRGVATSPIFVMEFIDSVVENLGDIGKISDSHSSQVEEVLRELNLLKSFVCFVSNRCIGSQSQVDFFTHVLVLAGHVAIIPWLYLPCHANGDQDLALDEVNVLLTELLRKRIKPIQPCVRKIYVEVLQALKSTHSRWFPVVPMEYIAECEASFVKILLHNLEEVSNVSTSSRVVALKDQMATLSEMLNLLRANLIPLPTQDLIFHVEDIDTVIVDVGLLVYSLYDNEEEKENVTFEEKNEAPVLDFQSNIQHIKAVIYLIIRKALQSNLPRIHGLGYVDFLLNNLKEFQVRYSNSLDFVNNHLQRIQDELESVQLFLKDVAEEGHNKQDRLQDCATLLISKAYEVEFMVDACISKEVPDWCLVRWFMDIVEEIILTKKEIMQIVEKKMVEFGLYDTTASADPSTQSATAPMMNQEIVGFEDVMGTLKEKLIKGSKELDVVSIVGMPGLGKTTLANKLYFDEDVKSHFDIRAQCVVSQVYTRKDLLLVLLRDAIGYIPVFHETPSEANVADTLRKVLWHNRYLILVDDIWETTAWDDLRSCFRDDNNGSRIILTTRDHEVAIYAKSVSDPLRLRMFKEDESWKLLEKKVFDKEKFSPHLTEVGLEIAKKCGRLPLSIVLVAGILAKMEKKEQCWRQVAAEFGPHIHNDSKNIIEKSYQHLPYHLRLCFLYFGAFLEDEEIKVSKLTSLWISEGFIKSCKDENLEDTADCYLENLIGRNVVTDVKRSSTGKVKTCRIHDLLLDFCKERANKENLILWIKRNQNANPSCCIYSHKQLAQRRMSIYAGMENLDAWHSSFSLVGSVFYRNDKKGHTTIYNDSYFSRYFKFLKVLDLEFIYVDSIPTELPYLRYFAATMIRSIVTSSIANPTNLETLILRSPVGSFSLPIALLKLVKLKHLQTYFEAYFTSHVAKELLADNSTKSYEWETLSSLCFSQADEMELMLRKAPNLRNLNCSLNDYSKSFPVLDFLTKLEAIKIYSRRLPFGRDAYIFPSNLKKLTLCYAKLGGPDESNIAMLPNLQVLKLKWVEFYNKEWKVSNEKSFPQLKVLKIVSCYWFDKWTVSDDAFPCLERLVLSGCKLLEEIPSHFEDKHSLRSIEVKACNESVVKSAMGIQEAQVDYMQNYGFKEAYVKALGRSFSGAPFKTFMICFGSYTGINYHLSRNSSDEASEISVNSLDDPSDLTGNWQFTVLELACCHYAAIYMEKDVTNEGL
ncbi:Late blight resistance protein R1-A [Capsicum annuum]|nr:Late blight resistance protein R1-A [Capsicum annuum]